MSRDAQGKLRQPAGTATGGQYAPDQSNIRQAPVSLGAQKGDFVCCAKPTLQEIEHKARARGAALGSALTQILLRTEQENLRALAATVRSEWPDAASVELESRITDDLDDRGMTVVRVADTDGNTIVHGDDISYETSERIDGLIANTGDLRTYDLVSSVPGLEMLDSGGYDSDALSLNIDYSLEVDPETLSTYGKESIKALLEHWPTLQTPAADPEPGADAPAGGDYTLAHINEQDRTATVIAQVSRDTLHY